MSGFPLVAVFVLFCLVVFGLLLFGDHARGSLRLTRMEAEDDAAELRARDAAESEWGVR